jgi:hypothetical protein
MTTDVAHILEQARKLTPQEQLDLISALADLARSALDESAEPGDNMTVDPVFALVGAYASELPLIDNISPSADPDLYLAAEAMGAQANGLHAWEIAPTRYMRGVDGSAVRKE